MADAWILIVKNASKLKEVVVRRSNSLTFYDIIGVCL